MLFMTFRRSARLARGYAYPPFVASIAEPAAAINRFVEKAARRTSTRRGLIMNKLLSGIATAAIVVLALPVWAQGVTTQCQPTRDNPPGTAWTSMPIDPGLLC